jgi:hypothetical protein
MTPVDQTIIDKDKGNCMSAAVASLLDMPLDKVPYFLGIDDWFNAFWKFLGEHGFEFHGTCFPGTYMLLGECPNVDGYLMASVPSRTFEGKGHSVIIDMQFNVVHDPNPNKAWQGKLIRDEVKDWFMISRKGEFDD